MKCIPKAYDGILQAAAMISRGISKLFFFFLPGHLVSTRGSSKSTPVSRLPLSQPHLHRLSHFPSAIVWSDVSLWSYEIARNLHLQYSARGYVTRWSQGWKWTDQSTAITYKSAAAVTIAGRLFFIQNSRRLYCGCLGCA